MKPQILSLNKEGANIPNAIGSKEHNMFAQMKLVGINPNPFIEIAAHDLLNQYGCDALMIAKNISFDFNNRGDFQAAEIWMKIEEYLSMLNGSGRLIAH